MIAQMFDERPGQQGVFQARLALAARADDVDRTRIGPQLFAHRREIDKPGHERSLRLGRPQQGFRPVAGREYERAAFAIGRGKLSRRVAAIESRDLFGECHALARFVRLCRFWTVHR